MVKGLITYFIALSLLFHCCLVFSGTRQHDKVWSGAVIVGSLSNDNKIKYYLQPQLSLIDDKYKFHSAFLYAGIGYRPESKMTFWIMNGYDITKRLNGDIRHLDIIRQQFNYVVMDNDFVNLNCVSRLEERKDLEESQWSLRLREMLSARLPFKNWENHSLVVFNEIFFSINHPAWINSNTLVDQNRAFIGIGTQITQQSTIDIGYMNQYQFRHTDDNNNILYMYLNVAG